METMEIARKLVALCREGKSAEAHKTLYAPNVVSVEAGAPPGGSAESEGLDALQKKSEWWISNHDIHSAVITGPWPNGNRFVVGFKYDVTNKPSGKRMMMEEVGLYTISKGKIVREEFFYDMSGM